MPVVGTAGHVDHGKSTLTKALSGRDPDRWAEEKRRGLTIDLGFAWTTLDDGTEVSFVDVPGHARYSKNMLAGIETIDVALFVVAADEGWMPQSEEHLAVLDLLGVRHAVVVLAKVDRVDADLVELATLEIEDRLQGTTLAGSPVVPVSAFDGTGMGELRTALAAAVTAAGRHDVGRPRLWVDRVFSASGAGTVVTGTLLDGPLAVDDRVAVLPEGIDARIRSIQSHESVRGRVGPQCRVALNLGGVAASDMARGSMVGRPEHWRLVSRLAATFRTARYVEELTDRGAYHLHIGSGAWPVRIRVVGDGLCTIDLPVDLPVTMGDRFILRDTGRRLVMAGGRVIDPDRGKTSNLRLHGAALAESLDRGPDARATALLAVRRHVRTDYLAVDSGGGVPNDAVTSGGSVMTVSEADALTEQLRLMVEAHHRDHPLRPGIPSAEATSRLGGPPDALAVLVERSPGLELDGSTLRSTSFHGVRSSEQEAAWELARASLRDAGPVQAPRVDELGIGGELVHALVREGELVRISPEFVYLPEWVAELVVAIRSFETPFTVADFKDRTNLSRKYAIPFLEWADRAGHTVRQGDTRRAR